jgi:hypothetical protein
MIEIGRVPLSHATQSPVGGVEGFLYVRNVVANAGCGGSVLCRQAAKIRSFSRANSLAAHRLAALFATAALTEDSTRRMIPCFAIARVDAFIDVLRGDGIFLARIV